MGVDTHIRAGAAQPRAARSGSARIPNGARRPHHRAGAEVAVDGAQPGDAAGRSGPRLGGPAGGRAGRPAVSRGSVAVPAWQRVDALEQRVRVAARAAPARRRAGRRCGRARAVARAAGRPSPARHGATGDGRRRGARGRPGGALMGLAVAIFAASLFVIATERVHRTKVALLGAAAVVLTQTIDQQEAIAAVDFNTLGLLAGMMLMVRLTEPTGVYNYLAIRAGQLSRGRPLAIVCSLATTTALLSAFLDNLTTVLLMVPITFLLADALDLDPIPLIVIEIIASNIGGTATLIGDPPNILIAGATGLSFVAFIVNLAPIAALTFAVVTGGLYLAYRKRLHV